MVESREDRLSRIRAAVDDVRAIPPTDAAWLLEQIPADYEYRVEGWTQIDGEGRQVWSTWNGPYPALEMAEETAAANRRYSVEVVGKPMKFRVVSAPVQVWTPVEEEQS